jgi:O-antigen/teichoic acid export membrane protein
MAASSVYTAAFPRFSTYHENHDELLKEFSFMSQLSSFLIVPAALTIAIFADDFMRFFLHTNQLNSNEDFLLAIIVIGTMMNSLMYLPVALVLASGSPRKLVAINVVSVLLFLPAIIYFTPIYGVIGAAWIWLILNFGNITFGAIYIFRKFPHFKKWKWYFFDILTPFLISISILGALRFIFIDVHNLFFVGIAFMLAAAGSFLCLPRLRYQLFALIKSP